MVEAWTLAVDGSARDVERNPVRHVKADGAELCSLRDAAGGEMLWQGAPVWPRHAPVLFPIVGRLKDDTLRHEGKSYRLTQHGFARDRRFAWLNRSATACRLVLHEDAETRAIYPFAFRLEIAYTLDDDLLEQRFTADQSGAGGVAGLAGSASGVRLAADRGRGEDRPRAGIRRARAGAGAAAYRGLLRDVLSRRRSSAGPSALEPALFAADAVILPEPVSRSVRYTAPGRRRSNSPGRASANSASGRVRAAISSASSLGTARPARGFRWRVQRQAWPDADPSRRAPDPVAADQAVLIGCFRIIFKLPDCALFSAKFLPYLRVIYPKALFPQKQRLVPLH